MTDTRDVRALALEHARFIVRLADAYEWDRITDNTCAAITERQARELLAADTRATEAERDEAAYMEAVRRHRERAEQLEQQLAETREEVDAIRALLPTGFQEKARDREYLYAYIEAWRDDAMEYATATAKAEQQLAEARAEIARLHEAKP